jgi:hypothetical protein
MARFQDEMPLRYRHRPGNFRREIFEPETEVTEISEPRTSPSAAKTFETLGEESFVYAEVIARALPSTSSVMAVTSALTYTVCVPATKPESLASKIEKLDEIELLYGEHNAPDWDGYDADAASEKSLSFAGSFIEFIPESLLNFEIDVEPNGWFAFEWYKPDSTLSIAFDELGEAHYAALLDGRGSYGTFSVAEGIPHHIEWMMMQAFSLPDSGLAQYLAGSSVPFWLTKSYD